MSETAKARMHVLFIAIAMAILPVGAAFAQNPQGNDEAASAPEEDRSVRRLGDIVSGGEDEFSLGIPDMDMAPAPEPSDVQLPDPDRQARLQVLLDSPAANGENTERGAELSALMTEVRGAALQSLAEGDLASARARQIVLESLAPALGVQTEIDAFVQAQGQSRTLSAGFREALDAGRLIEPRQDAALGYLIQLRQSDQPTVDPDSLEAELQQAMIERFTSLLEDGQVEAASTWLGHLESLSVPVQQLNEIRERLRALRDDRLGQFRQQFDLALAAMEVDSAALLLQRIESLGADPGEVGILQDRLSQLGRYGRFRPGEVFADRLPEIGEGPEMVVIPAGTATLGAPADEAGRFDDEGPRFDVVFDRGFALSRTEITVAEFRRFVRATDYRSDAERRGESNIFDLRGGSFSARRRVDWEDDFRGRNARDDAPVAHVSFNDARAYTAWLSKASGHTYRLPSEAEFEYALRAGSQSSYWWGNGVPENAVENLAGDRDRIGRGQRWTEAFSNYGDGHWGPAAVGSFSPNPFGLFDIGGNQLEWVADCWISGYQDPPVSGLARVRTDCDRHVLRGGAWSNGPRTSRSAYRLAGSADFTDARVGFRVARELQVPGDGLRNL